MALSPHPPHLPHAAHRALSRKALQQRHMAKLYGLDDTEAQESAQTQAQAQAQAQAKAKVAEATTATAAATAKAQIGHKVMPPPPPKPKPKKPMSLEEQRQTMGRTYQSRLNFNSYLIRRKQDTYCYRICDDSMRHEGLLEGDYVLVERNVPLSDGDLVACMYTTQEGIVASNRPKKRKKQRPLLAGEAGFVTACSSFSFSSYDYLPHSSANGVAVDQDDADADAGAADVDDDAEDDVHMPVVIRTYLRYPEPALTTTDIAHRTPLHELQYLQIIGVVIGMIRAFS